MSEQSTSTSTLPAFGTLANVEITRTDTVVIPDDVRADFARAVTYFSGQSNRVRLTVGFPTEDDAKTFCKRADTYGKETGHRALCQREGSKVTFRFSKPRGASKTSPVVVTNVSDAK